MPPPLTISLDAMGGDHGPSVVLSAAALFLKKQPDVRFLLYGDEATLTPLLAQHPALKAAAHIRHASVSIRMNDKPSHALRIGRKHSSMWLAIDAVRQGEASAAVSAGNTGALMAMAKVCLKTIAHIDRPAIAAVWPTLQGKSIVLDVGATIGADARHLVDLAIMGAAMGQMLLGKPQPTVGLLNVGVEEIKGLEAIKDAGQILRNSKSPHFLYHGFVEGDDLGRGTTDVVVTEGFAGNIALKAAEGTAKQIGAYLRAEMNRTLLAKIGALFARGAFRALKNRMDPRQVNGGVFLGLNGIVVKSHGGADALGLAHAIEMASTMARGKLLTTVVRRLEDLPVQQDGVQPSSDTSGQPN